MRSFPQSCRARLQRRDFVFIAEALTGVGPGGANPDTLLGLATEESTLNLFLDDPKLLRAILTIRYPISITPELYFYVLVRHALTEAGIDHVELADYVAATLANEASGYSREPDGPNQLSGASYHVDFVQAIRNANTRERFFLHVSCGNRFLVLTGLFPKFLQRREERRGAPGLDYYEGVARESFRSASGHPLAGEFAVSEVLQLLAEVMPRARRALNRLSSEYLFLGA